MASCKKIHNVDAAGLNMLQPDMLQFEHVAAGHVAAFSSMLQSDMLPHFEHVAAGHVQLRLLLTRDTSRCSTGLFSVHTSVYTL